MNDWQIRWEKRREMQKNLSEAFKSIKPMRDIFAYPKFEFTGVVRECTKWHKWWKPEAGYELEVSRKLHAHSADMIGWVWVSKAEFGAWQFQTLQETEVNEEIEKRILETAIFEYISINQGKPLPPIIEPTQKDEAMRTPFNLEQALAGAPLITRDGRKARILVSKIDPDVKAPVLYAIEGENEVYGCSVEYAEMWPLKGDSDLFMAPVKKETKTIYINEYKDGGMFAYANKQIAEIHSRTAECVLAAYPVEIPNTDK